MLIYIMTHTGQSPNGIHVNIALKRFRPHCKTTSLSLYKVASVPSRNRLPVRAAAWAAPWRRRAAARRARAAAARPALAAPPGTS